MMGSILPILSDTIAPVFFPLRMFISFGLFRHIFHINKHYHALETHTHARTHSLFDRFIHTYAVRYTHILIYSYIGNFCFLFSLVFLFLASIPITNGNSNRSRINKNTKKKKFYYKYPPHNAHNILHLDRNFALFEYLQFKVFDAVGFKVN